MFHDVCGTLLKKQKVDGKEEYYCPACKVAVELKDSLRKEEKIITNSNSVRGNILDIGE
ncbi:MAG: hypothetical protein QXZ38_04155 [Candidatus Micrarchaeaceae archaeon]